jgi:hypothetical protein
MLQRAKELAMNITKPSSVEEFTLLPDTGTTVYEFNK